MSVSIEVSVLVIALSATKLIVKSKDGTTPLFANPVSQAAYKQYLEGGEEGDFTVTIASDTAFILEGTSVESIEDRFFSLPACVRMPSHHDTSVNPEQMYLYWNMHEIGNRWVLERI
tara:strand:- start:379 stop:729 length:351 start_codon:yes stop_codon:yes gene_type:complete